ncbi:MAG: hypothetical protein IM597_20415 [Pseudanabaena sp. M176S2SP2A07QC]|nr:hypothetical protein [Pseudanabaena sp. M176S2SP2A07QC]MCA6560544.1 hypothetical protein [Pseudanabaena sp. M079S1SP2A07QC]MCA6566625.1 hypothetical protein [Pseudanabaena sp. M151S2SP2A07QC]
MAERSSAIFWVLCPKQSLHCYIIREFLPTIWRQTVRRKSMGKISGTSTMGTI